MFRKGHRLDKRRIALAEFSAADHVVVVSAGTGRAKVDELLELAYVDHPKTLPEIAINLFWHAKYHKNPANEAVPSRHARPSSR